MASIKLSPRLSRIKLSPSTIAAQKVRDLRAAGGDIIGLTIGEPDFNTPEHVKRAVVAAMDRNETKYPPIFGIPQLREAVRRKFIRDNGLDYAVDQIMVGTEDGGWRASAAPPLALAPAGRRGRDRGAARGGRHRGRLTPEGGRAGTPGLR